MIDLTPLDVRKKSADFRRVLRGYDTQEVDGFLQLAAERLEELVKENLALRERSERLGRELTGHEGRESAVKEALVMAQQLREDLKAQAEREAELLRNEADADARHRIAETDAEVRQRLAEADAGIRQRLADTDADIGRRLAETDADVRERVAEAERRLEDARRGLAELERRRLLFLKSLRSLLERELEVVAVEETGPSGEAPARPPDAPALAEHAAADEGGFWLSSVLGERTREDGGEDRRP